MYKFFERLYGSRVASQPIGEVNMVQILTKLLLKPVYIVNAASCHPEPRFRSSKMPCSALDMDPTSFAVDEAVGAKN